MINARTIEGLLLLGLGFALGWIFGGWNHECPDLLSVPPTMIESIDTVERIVERPPIVVQARPRVVRVPEIITYVDTVVVADSLRLDTVLRSEPFEMALDTVSDRGDSITAIARFPPPSMAIAIRPRPDTALDRTRIVVVDRPVPIREPWYKEPAKAGAYITGGMILGYVFRLVTEPECTRIEVGAPALRPAHDFALVNLSIGL